MDTPAYHKDSSHFSLVDLKAFTGDHHLFLLQVEVQKGKGYAKGKTQLRMD